MFYASAICKSGWEGWPAEGTYVLGIARDLSMEVEHKAALQHCVKLPLRLALGQLSVLFIIGEGEAVTLGFEVL